MIDYKLLNDSVEYYSKLGYQRIEAPWLVSPGVDNITRPNDRVPYQLKHNNKCLVASGEQSFLYLYLKGYLTKGTYQTITPCFRAEDFDFLHSKYFMKNELIDTKNVTKVNLNKIASRAFDFYSTLFCPDDLTFVETEDSIDIEVCGKELGSYGIRECEFLKWIYGTALAEPRTSNLIKLYGVSH